MEAAGAKILYQRSVKLRKLRYIPFIGDGDSKAHTAVKQEQPYGPAVFIPKQECVSHVTKRMGTGLRALVRDYKGKCLGCVHVYCYIGRSFKPNVVVVVVLISVEMRATSSLSFFLLKDACSFCQTVPKWRGTVCSKLLWHFSAFLYFIIAQNVYGLLLIFGTKTTFTKNQTAFFSYIVILHFLSDDYFSES